MHAVGDVISLIWSYIQTVRITDILDISIVAYIIYRLITVVRKTSSGSVVKGIILMIALIWLSSILNLNVINYLLGQLMNLGIIVLIILFTPEIRRFLEQVGSRNFSFLIGRHVKIENVEACIAQTVLACTEMSKSKTGVLIVFERDILLNDYINTGTKLDSLLSSELLKNIFYPNSPLHDGAVIVRNGKIAAAGCMLPLSSNTNISRDLGMRHRAGIGMSERSDAISVIVSEETGSISVAVNGMLKRHLAQETFEKLLSNELILDDQDSTVSDKAKRKFRVGK